MTTTHFRLFFCLFVFFTCTHDVCKLSVGVGDRVGGIVVAVDWQRFSDDKHLGLQRMDPKGGSIQWVGCVGQNAFWCQELRGGGGGVKLWSETTEQQVYSNKDERGSGGGVTFLEGFILQASQILHRFRMKDTTYLCRRIFFFVVNIQITTFCLNTLSVTT